MPKYTQKELDVLAKFGDFIKRLNTSQNQSIGTSIQELSVNMPNHIALLFEDASWTWKEFNEESNKVANFFLKLGITRGDAVGLMLENSPEYLFLTTGINKVQGISALINYNQKKKALTHSFNIVNSKWVVVDGNCLGSLKEIKNDLPCLKENIFVINNYDEIPHEFTELPKELNDSPIANPNTTYKSVLKETALYIYTSGTTGLPKAVNMLNYKLFTQGGYLGISLTNINSNDVIYNALPLYHNIPFGTAWISSVLTGATLALSKRFSASRFWKEIHKYKATCMSYVGEILRYLLNQPPSKLEKNNTLTKMNGVGLRKDVWLKVKSRFQIDHIYEYYGLTEGHRLFFNADEVPGMIGRNNMPGIRIAKVNPETGELLKNEDDFCIKSKNGDTGMILLKIEKNDEFRGYKDKEKTENKIFYNVFKDKDSYFNTGDMVKVHADLYLSFADRSGDTYRWKSENVSTLEVEEILSSFPAIELSGVYGVSIPNTEGKAGMATIKLDTSSNFNLDDLAKFVIESLPSYSIPLFIRIKDEIELTGPMKIRKFNLKKEGYNIDLIKDPLYFWDSSNKKYITLDKAIYQNILGGKIKF